MDLEMTNLEPRGGTVQSEHFPRTMHVAPTDIDAGVVVTSDNAAQRRKRLSSRFDRLKHIRERQRR